jgi:maleamate amidohydrolase
LNQPRLPRGRRVWDDVIGDEEKALYARAGYGRAGGFGHRPAVLLVDLYVTDVRLPDRTDFHDPAPASAELNVGAIRRLLEAARRHELPVFYSTNLYREDGRDLGGWRHKNGAAESHARALGGRPYPFLPAVAPRPGDWIIHKQKPSVFFGTPLVSHLVDLGVDTLLVGGQTTSGCVRATVLDAFSYGFRTVVIEECTFDRGTVSHKVNLFDMHQKYADVTPLGEVLDYLRRLACSGSPASS